MLCPIISGILLGQGVSKSISMSNSVAFNREKFLSIAFSARSISSSSKTLLFFNKIFFFKKIYLLSKNYVLLPNLFSLPPNLLSKNFDFLLIFIFLLIIKFNFIDNNISFQIIIIILKQKKLLKKIIRH